MIAQFFIQEVKCFIDENMVALFEIRRQPRLEISDLYMLFSECHYSTRFKHAKTGPENDKYSKIMIEFEKLSYLLTWSERFKEIV